MARVRVLAKSYIGGRVRQEGDEIADYNGPIGSNLQRLDRNGGVLPPDNDGDGRPGGSRPRGRKGKGEDTTASTGEDTTPGDSADDLG